MKFSVVAVLLDSLNLNHIMAKWMPAADIIDRWKNQRRLRHWHEHNMKCAIFFSFPSSFSWSTIECVCESIEKMKMKNERNQFRFDSFGTHRRHAMISTGSALMWFIVSTTIIAHVRCRHRTTEVRRNRRRRNESELNVNHQQRSKSGRKRKKKIKIDGNKSRLSSTQQSAVVDEKALSAFSANPTNMARTEKNSIHKK